MIFQAENRSMRMSDGRRSCGAIFFLIKLCCLDTDEPCLLLARDVARDMETESLLRFMMLSSSGTTTTTTGDGGLGEKTMARRVGRADVGLIPLTLGTIAP